MVPTADLCQASMASMAEVPRFLQRDVDRANSWTPEGGDACIRGPKGPLLSQRHSSASAESSQGPGLSPWEDASCPSLTCTSTSPSDSSPLPILPSEGHVAPGAPGGGSESETARGKEDESHENARKGGAGASEADTQQRDAPAVHQGSPGAMAPAPRAPSGAPRPPEEPAVHQGGTRSLNEEFKRVLMLAGLRRGVAGTPPVLQGPRHRHKKSQSSEEGILVGGAPGGGVPSGDGIPGRTGLLQSQLSGGEKLLRLRRLSPASPSASPPADAPSPHPLPALPGGGKSATSSVGKGSREGERAHPLAARHPSPGAGRNGSEPGLQPKRKSLGSTKERWRVLTSYMGSGALPGAGLGVSSASPAAGHNTATFSLAAAGLAGLAPSTRLSNDRGNKNNSSSQGQGASSCHCSRERGSGSVVLHMVRQSEGVQLVLDGHGWEGRILEGSAGACRTLGATAAELRMVRLHAIRAGSSTVRNSTVQALRCVACLYGLGLAGRPCSKQPSLL